MTNEPLNILPPTASGAEDTSSDRFTVKAQDGLRVRSGPDTTFPVVASLAFGSEVAVLQRQGVWAQIDANGDGVADGFVHGDFLEAGSAEPQGEPQAGEPQSSASNRSGGDILDLVTPTMVRSIFTPATTLAHIAANLPFVWAGLRGEALADKPMALMALATIRAETEGFVPISEGQSRFNTASSPFDLYDAGTQKGADLGNTQRGDGPLFKGRGFVQLTGRSNYTRIGRQIAQPLDTQPELANDPTLAGVILAKFLKNKEGDIRNALAASDLARARKLVNGGSHGLDQFSDTYRRGLTVLPG